MHGTHTDHRPPDHRPHRRRTVCAAFSSLVVTPIGCRRGVPWVKLARPLRYRCRINGGGLEAEVPEGFETDYASVPRGLWSILPPNGQWTEAAVLHDYLYQHGGCSRFMADALLRDSMRVLGVSWWRRVLFFYAVRLFGWLYFRRDKRGRVMATENDPGAIALKDVWDLIEAAVDTPEWADPLEVEGWLREMAGPFARIVAEFAGRVQAVADDKTKGWEQLLPVVVPLVVQIIAAWRKRRQSDVPSPSPTNV